MVISLLILATALVFICIKLEDKIDFLEMRARSEKIEAEVIDFRQEKKERMRNDYVINTYIYVKILSEGPNQGKERRLQYAYPLSGLNLSWPFKIGETIDVFWSGGELFYWNAMDKGVARYLPNKWPWKK